MIYNSKYIIKITPSFEEELKSIYTYIELKLKEPNTAKILFNKIINKIYSLETYPERYIKVSINSDKTRNIRKLIFEKYVIIYEIDNQNGQIFILHIFHNTQNYLRFI